jgi:ABC-type proline/glycine betaine transport system ATPase subunit
MKMITGLIDMSAGHIFFNGQPIQDDLIAYKRSMGSTVGRCRYCPMFAAATGRFTEAPK